MKTTEFTLKINGLELPKDTMDIIAGELQKTLRREIAKLDLKGGLHEPKSMGGFPGGGTAGMVADFS